MVRKRRKEESEEGLVLISSEPESEEIIEETFPVEEEIITGFDSPLMRKVESLPPPEPPKTRKIEYLGVAEVFIIRGPITGERYRFTSKDRISTVAIEDYEGLLQRVRPARRCCGRRAGDPGRMVSSQPYFGPV